MIRTKIQPVFSFLLVVMVLGTSIPGATQLEDRKPLVVVICADWSPLCQKLKPVLVGINEKYRRKIHFVRLDVTSEETTRASRQEAQRFGLESFFDKYRDRTSLVVIQHPTGHEIFRAMHDYDFQHYASVLDQVQGMTAKTAGR